MAEAAIAPTDPPADPPADPPVDPPADPPAKPSGSDDPPADDWRAPITDKSLREIADRFNAPVDVIKAVADLRKRESTSIRVPGKDASDKDVAAYRKALGVPEKADGYKFEVPEGHEPTDADTAFQTSAAEAFHGLDISTDQAKGLAEWFSNYSAQAEKQQADDLADYAAESKAALEAEWPGEEYKRNEAAANEGLRYLFKDSVEEVKHIEMKDGGYLLDNPIFLKALAALGRETATKGALDRTMSDGDRDGVQNQINELEKKIEKAQRDGDRSTANKLYAEQQGLYRKIHGTGPIVGAEGRAA